MGRDHGSYNTYDYGVQCFVVSQGTPMMELSRSGEAVMEVHTPYCRFPSRGQAFLSNVDAGSWEASAHLHLCVLQLKSEEFFSHTKQEHVSTYPDWDEVR